MRILRVISLLAVFTLSACGGGDSEQASTSVPGPGPSTASSLPVTIPVPTGAATLATYCANVKKAYALKPADGELNAASRQKYAQYAKALEPVAATAPASVKGIWQDNVTLTNEIAQGRETSPEAQRAGLAGLGQLGTLITEVQKDCNIDIGS